MARELDFVDECYAGKDLSLLKKLTLVIPTFNRDYLKRCLWYHAHFPFGQIIVADSSFDEKKIENREIIAKIRDEFSANILHLEYQPETEKYGGDIYQKWGDAVQHVETEYSQICTDKEFVIPTVCCESIAFLAKNPDYINAFGRRGNCTYNSSTIEITPFGDMESCGDQPSANERIGYCNFAKGIPENLFQIYQSKTHKLIYSNLDKNSINDFRFGELLLELSPYCIGKCKKLNTFGRIRDLTHSTEKGFNKRVIKSESSSSRYPFLDTYPEEMRENTQKSFEQRMFALLPCDDRSNENKKKLEEELNQIIHRWMWTDPENKKNIRSLLWGILWGAIPEKPKLWLSSRLGTGKYVSERIDTHNNTYTETIIRIISMTNESPHEVIWKE